MKIAAAIRPSAQGFEGSEAWSHVMSDDDDMLMLSESHLSLNKAEGCSEEMDY